MNADAHNKVVVVDDDPSILRILTVFLESDGYQVFQADDGPTALELVNQEHPSYLITDWDMPGITGLELCRQVRELDLPHYLYTVFLTSRSEEGDLVAAMNAGADDFLNKPIRKPELLARLTAGARLLSLESRLALLASHDTLSGLLLRRSFNGFLQKEWHRARRYRLPLSAVMLDIDFFKRVNDTYGHAAGDEAIRVVAEFIRQHTRECDIICRYGGEEFCVLLPETDENAAKIWADRLRQRIADATIKAGTVDLQLTVSFGVAELLADMEDTDELLGLADQCMLAAKNQGRNRVISLRELSESGSLVLDDAAIHNQLKGVVARDAMIPLVHCLQGDWPLVRASAYFLQFRVSSAPVTNQNGELLGVVADKDALAIAHNADAPHRLVQDVMRANVISYEDTVPLATVLNFLTRASMRSVVITNNGKPSGLITRAGLLRWFLEHHWRALDSEPTVAQRDRSVCNDATVENDSALLKLAYQLTVEADALQKYLRSPDAEQEVAPIVGGASRMQQLIDDLLAGSASGNRTGGGLPF